MACVSSKARISPTPKKAAMKGTNSRFRSLSRKIKTDASKTQNGAVLSNQIALAAVVCTIALRKVMFIPAKLMTMGMSIGRKRTPRTKGNKTHVAATARQNPNMAPRHSTGQSSKKCDLVKKPLLLQRITAAKTHSRAVVLFIIVCTIFPTGERKALATSEASERHSL